MLKTLKATHLQQYFHLLTVAHRHFSDVVPNARSEVLHMGSQWQKYMIPFTCMKAIVWCVKDVCIIEFSMKFQPFHQFFYKIVHWKKCLPSIYEQDFSSWCYKFNSIRVCKCEDYMHFTPQDTYCTLSYQVQFFCSSEMLFYYTNHLLYLNFWQHSYVLHFLLSNTQIDQSWSTFKW